jgi:long-chain acyl-CoA synthetase
MNRPWLSQYPPGVPAEIDIAACASLKDLLATTCARFAEAPAYSSMGSVLSFRQLDEASRAFAAWLQKEARLQRGDRVALMLPNLLQYPVALFGACAPGWWWSTSTRCTHHANSAPALRTPAPRPSWCWRISRTRWQQVIGSTAVRTVITTQVGDLLPPCKRC